MAEQRDRVAQARDRLQAAGLVGTPVRGIQQVNRGAALIVRVEVAAPLDAATRERIEAALGSLWYELVEVRDGADGRRPGVTYGPP